MSRFLVATALLGAMASTAAAKPSKKAPPPPPVLPAVGDALPLAGHATWPAEAYLYDAPSAKDAAGKVVVHWFCAPRTAACVEDLARLVTLKENGRVYIVAHLSGTKGQVGKLDPIRESEGVGKGTVAFGKVTMALAKKLGLTAPVSIVIGVDGKVALVATGGEPAILDARDKQVADLVAGIKEYVLVPSAAPRGIKPGEPFTLSMQATLSSWLTVSDRSPREFKLTAPPDFTCDAKELRSDKLVVDAERRTLTATVTCRAPKGIYEARGDLRFGFDSAAGATGLGSEGARWKFEIKP